VTYLTGLAGGWAVEDSGEALLMATRPFDFRSTSAASPWSLCSSTSNRSYLVAAMRAGAIALVLLGILALLVLL
jgi:hypothetical protein